MYTSIHIACRVHYRESVGVRLCDCMRLCLRTNIIVVNRKPENLLKLLLLLKYRYPTTGRGGPRGSGYVKAPDLLEFRLLLLLLLLLLLNEPNSGSLDSVDQGSSTAWPRASYFGRMYVATASLLGHHAEEVTMYVTTRVTNTYHLIKYQWQGLVI
jgi:hypothetical protein